jgi:hypothetical protein
MKRSAQLYKKGCNDHPTTNLRKEENLPEDQNGNYAAFLPLSSEEFCEDASNNSVIRSTFIHCVENI